MEEINENSIPFFLPKNIPIATKVNIVTALTTEADSPAIRANTHKRKIIQSVFINTPYVILSKGFNKKETSNKITPTCKPETAKM
jgi:hypothetical protein